jgi:fucose 4-O-acetylase-like acetyltransferase
MDRLNNLDALKALCCLGVICVHAPLMTRADGLTWVDQWVSAAGTFAVPAFFMISGYFFIQSNNPYSWERLQQIVFRLAIPFILYMLFYFLFFTETGLRICPNGAGFLCSADRDFISGFYQHLD